MKYNNTVKANFLERPNRFIAKVEIKNKWDKRVETVHVKNTGRCRELLLPGCEVVLGKSENPNRKTLYDLISVYKRGLGWVNIDSQVPNKVVREWLDSKLSPFGNVTHIKPEYKYGNSRMDFYLEYSTSGSKSKERITTKQCCRRETDDNSNMDMANPKETIQKVLIEVKGCTLEIDGVGYFPDAPTVRGVKHLRELAEATKTEYECYLIFVIAMPKVKKVLPNINTHPEFGEALEEAVKSGVKVIYLECDVTPDSISPISYTMSKQTN